MIEAKQSSLTDYHEYFNHQTRITMITINDIDNTVNNDMIMYIDDNDITYQYETWDPMTLQELEDAKSQFALILNISDRSAETIENHMQLNGFDGIADVYTW